MGIVIYRVAFDTDKYEEEQGDLSEETYKKYKKPLYIESLYRASFIRAYYGAKYVHVSKATNIEWEEVNWEKINGMSAAAMKDAQ